MRGFRIEPGEIEAALRGHPSVLDVTVAVQEVAGEKALVAYVVTEEGAEPLGVDTMRAFLHDKLPAYMVPTALMALDALPLTPNGKVDRRALPVPGSERPQLSTAYTAPRTHGGDRAVRGLGGGAGRGARRYRRQLLRPGR